MRHKILLSVATIIAIAVAIVGYTQSKKGAAPEAATATPATTRQAQREARHLAREKRRAERQAEYVRYIDSIVLARNFQFSPQTMQQMTGPTRILNNPEFGVEVMGSEVDVFLPYVKGVTPPYYTVILNYALPSVARYTTEQTHEGWHVTFSSSLYTGSDYGFSLEIYAASGSGVLTISSPWYNDVQYNGSISGI